MPRFEIDLQVAKDLLDAGHSASSIARHFGTSTQTVQRRLAEANIEALQPHQRIPTHEASNLYQEGYTARELAERYSVSPQTVQRALLHVGVALRGKAKTPRSRKLMSERRQKPLDEDRIRAMANLSMSTREMATELGVSEECVRERMVRLDVPRLPAKARMEHNGFWKGGRIQDRDGYWLVKSPRHPYATKQGYVREHRLVMEQMIGRYLLPAEVVDHIDRNTSNNDPSNLRLFASNALHLKATLTGRRPQWSVEGERSILDGLQRGREKLATNHPMSKTDVAPSPLPNDRLQE